MAFNTFAFLGFFTAVIILYYALPGKLRPFLAAVASLAFYAIYDIKLTALLAVYTVYVYLFGLAASKNKSKPVLAAMIIGALAPLLICKYLNLGLSICDAIIGKISNSWGTHAFSIVIPLGISYFTFKSIGYIVDVYKGSVEPERNFVIFAAFVTFFPEMLAGPIDRSDNLLKQLRDGAPKRFTDVQAGILMLFWGYFEKMCVADRLKIIVDGVYSDLYSYRGAIVILSIACYSLEIYLDFAGCTHMALGVGKALGFDLPINFRQPYLSVSVRDFWRNWHISLMDWFKDYVYIPMGGSRKGMLRKYINALTVFALSGLWHGAGLSFLLWGILNGLLQIGGNILNPFKDKVYRALKIAEDSEGLAWFKRLGTFILMSCTWVFFRAESTRQALLIFKRAFAGFDAIRLFDGTLYLTGLTDKNAHILVLFLLIILIFDYCCLKGFKPVDFILKSHWLFKSFVFILLVLTVVVFGIYGTAYDAGSFIYMQF